MITDKQMVPRGISCLAANTLAVCPSRVRPSAITPMRSVNRAEGLTKERTYHENHIGG